jgi:uncharacterized membrane protein YphA (DoxX/SURF4 family)
MPPLRVPHDAVATGPGAAGRPGRRGIGDRRAEVTVPFVGVCEVVCGVLFVLGLLTRFAAVTMTVNMVVAISIGFLWLRDALTQSLWQ